MVFDYSRGFITQKSFFSICKFEVCAHLCTQKSVGGMLRLESLLSKGCIVRLSGKNRRSDRVANNLAKNKWE